MSRSSAFARVYAPRDQLDLYFASSLLESAGFDFYIENEHFARLQCYPVQHADYLQPWIYVPAEDAPDAQALFAAEPVSALEGAETEGADLVPGPGASPMRRGRSLLVNVASLAVPVAAWLALAKVGLLGTERHPSGEWDGASTLILVLANPLSTLAILAAARLPDPALARLRKGLVLALPPWILVYVYYAAQLFAP